MTTKKRAPPCTITILLMGDSNVGKSLMSQCFLQGGPLERYQTNVTVSPEYVKVDYTMKGVGEFSVMYIDPPGTPTSRDLVASYFRDAHALIGVFDVMDNKTYAHLRDEWLPTASRWRDTDNVPVLIVGNKIDLLRKAVATAEAFDARVAELQARARADFASFPQGLEYVETITASARNWVFPETPSRLDLFVKMVVTRAMDRQRASDKSDAAGRGIRLLLHDVDAEKMKADAANDECGTC